MTALVTPALLAVVLSQDLIAAVTIAVTIPLVPLFMALVGWMTQSTAARRLVTMQRLGAQVLDLLAGLPTLVAMGRERGPAARVRELGEAHRRATTATLRTAFLSAAGAGAADDAVCGARRRRGGLRLLRGASTCAPRSSCWSWRLRCTCRCARWARSSTPAPTGSRQPTPRSTSSTVPWPTTGRCQHRTCASPPSRSVESASTHPGRRDSAPRTPRSRCGRAR